MSKSGQYIPAKGKNVYLGRLSFSAKAGRIRKDLQGAWATQNFGLIIDLRTGLTLIVTSRLVSVVNKVPVYRARGLGSIPGGTNTRGLMSHDNGYRTNDEESWVKRFDKT